MLEAARRASCVGNVNNARAIVIWKDQASEELIKKITPPLGYQQMQTAPCFILWYNDTSAYEIEKWLSDLHNLADTRRIGTDAGDTKADIERLLRPVFGATWQQMAVAPLAFMDVGLAVCQAMLTAYDEGLGVCLMSSPRLEQVGNLLKLPETAVPVCLMAVGYPAESWQAGGQTVKAPFDSLFHEMEYGKEFARDEAVVDELTREGLIQEAAPLAWRDEELKYLEKALGLARTIIAFPAPAAASTDGGGQ
jgi:nitroreductase